MDKVLYACGLEFVHAGRGTGHYEHGASVKILERRNGIFCILVVARAQHNNVGAGLQCGINTFFHGFETEVVYNLITGAGSDELMGEVSEDQAVAFNYYFSHSVIHSIEESNDQIVNVRWEDESNFVLMDDRTQEYNFRPTAESQVIDWGNPADAQAYPLDRDGNPRLTDAAPDAGCYEAQPQDDGQQQE